MSFLALLEFSFFLFFSGVFVGYILVVDTGDVCGGLRIGRLG